MQTIEMEALEQELRGLGEFYYWPNNGNLGDLLIAEATRQYFKSNNILWSEYNPESPPECEAITLVYGGGGRFTSHWGGLDEHIEHLTHPRVKRGIILPHSFYGVDDFIKRLDDRYTIFCRDQRSYEYCLSLAAQPTVMLAGDMGLALKIEVLPIEKPLLRNCSSNNKEEHKQNELLQRGWATKVVKSVQKATIKSKIGGRFKKLAFLLRTDKEKATNIQSPFTYDISLAWCASCRETVYNSYFIRIFANALMYPDVVVTDRLHVAIMAMHVGREVYMLDNDYGKLSGVYEVSLKNRPNVHLLSPGEPWPEEIVTAWQCLNAPWRRLLYRVRFVLPTKIWNFSKHVLRRLLMR